MNSHGLTIQLTCRAQTQTICPIDEKFCSTYIPVPFLPFCITILKSDLCFFMFIRSPWLLCGELTYVGQQEKQGEQLEGYCSLGGR